MAKYAVEVSALALIKRRRCIDVYADNPQQAAIEAQDRYQKMLEKQGAVLPYGVSFDSVTKLSRK